MTNGQVVAIDDWLRSLWNEIMRAHGIPHACVREAPTMTEAEAIETLLGKPPDVQRRNELERQFDLLRSALTDGRLTEWHVYDRPLERPFRTITFTFRDEPQ